MKKLFISALVAVTAVLSVNAQSQYGSTPYGSSYGTSVNSSTRYQNGYYRSDGTYVQGHYKTTSNGTNHDNYSTSGNYNYNTGTTGSRARDYSTGAYNYGSGKTIHTGSRGGQYYINSNGNKTYVPKRQ